MIYLFYGIESYLIDKEIRKIIDENKIDEYSVEKYDLTSCLLDNIIDSCKTSCLFSDKKCVIVNNSYIFSGTSKKNSIEQNIEVLDNYLDSLNENTILIFTCNNEKIDERKKIVKKIKTKYIVKEFNKVQNASDIVKTFFNDYYIDSSTLNLFVDRVGNNLPLLANEAEKLRIYKFDEKKISKDDILKIVNKNVDLDIFKLIDNIVLKNKKEAIIVYNEMLKYGEEPIKIMIMLANQFRLMYQVKMLYRKGYLEKDIASTLTIHPYRVKLALEKSKKFTEINLLNYLEKLSNLDYKIKSSDVDKKLALELFIIEL